MLSSISASSTFWLSTAAAPALQNAGDSVRLEQPEWSAVGHRTFVPEPGVLFQQLGSGAVLLALLAIRRRRAASSTRHLGENLE